MILVLLVVAGKGFTLEKLLCISSSFGWISSGLRPPELR
jgi:hypothetical protein